MCKPNLIIGGLLLFYSALPAQDKIYYTKNRIDNWKVTELNPQYLKGVDIADTGLAYSTTTANVLFIFNKAGNFVVIPGMYDPKKSSELYVKNFFTKDKTIFNELDKIITTKNDIIICHYQASDEKNVVYKANKKEFSIPKGEVAVIIFKNGEHQLLTSIEKAYKVLNVVQDKYTDLALAKYENTVTPDDTPPVKPDSQKLPPSTVLKLQNKALVNIKQLGYYIQMICQKDTEPEDATKTIEQALALFIGDARIEVSSINRSTVNQFAIKDYLIKLGYLKYEKVIIEWYNIQYTSLLRKGPDGFYYGTIEFEQRFVGTTADNRKYEDITRKTVEVVLKSYERNTGGETIMEWDVFLGDIGVTVTKPA